MGKQSRLKKERRQMEKPNEFTKSTGPVPGPAATLPITAPPVAYQLIIGFAADGRPVNIGYPNNMPANIAIQHLAVAINVICSKLQTGPLQPQEQPAIIGIKGNLASLGLPRIPRPKG